MGEEDGDFGEGVGVFVEDFGGVGEFATSEVLVGEEGKEGATPFTEDFEGGGGAFGGVFDGSDGPADGDELIVWGGGADFCEVEAEGGELFACAGSGEELLHFINVSSEGGGIDAGVF